MKTYAPLPVTFSHGEGVWLWDEKGNKYLDALCGIAVTGLGHAHPVVSAAICEQAGRLLHTSNLFEIGLQKQLADKLTALSGMDNVFFSNSGALKFVIVNSYWLTNVYSSMCCLQRR